VLHEVFEQTAVADRGDAVLDPFGTEAGEGVPDAPA
jgi:hypothetical protein